jgi:hypothetical protein
MRVKNEIYGDNIDQNCDGNADEGFTINIGNNVNVEFELYITKAKLNIFYIQKNNITNGE